jgi:purine nucleosidase
LPPAKIILDLDNGLTGPVQDVDDALALALALLAAPEIAPRIRGVVHMGGVFAPPGGGAVWQTPDIPDAVWRTTLRFNTLFDPEAAAVVFRSGVPVTLVPANVTVRVFWRPGHQARLGRHTGALQGYLHRWVGPWLEWSRRIRRLPGAHLHDPLTLGVAMDPDFCRFAELRVNVARLLGERPGWLGRGRTGLPVRAAVGVAAERFEDFLEERLCAPLRPRYRAAPGA